MTPLKLATAILALTIALTACKHRKEEPIPGPRATDRPAVVATPAEGPAATRSVRSESIPAGSSSHGAIHPQSILPGPVPPRAPAPDSASPSGQRRHGASGISWFQGGFEEAFSCPKCTAMFWREALDR